MAYRHPEDIRLLDVLPVLLLGGVPAVLAASVFKQPGPGFIYAVAFFYGYVMGRDGGGAGSYVCASILSLIVWLSCREVRGLALVLGIGWAAGAWVGGRVLRALARYDWASEGVIYSNQTSPVRRNR